jgi:hypothetical protein
MRVFLFEIRTGIVESTFRQVLAIADDEGEARSYVLSKFTGWSIDRCIEVRARPVHFVLGDLEEGDK